MEVCQFYYEVALMRASSSSSLVILALRRPATSFSLFIFKTGSEILYESIVNYLEHIFFNFSNKFLIH